ncbi:MAG: hypothetical protein K2Y22_09325 [Candidatus Obscuribacterales bacterium]|nr:hypothetical protein [Candidatus Obscuribacterales bacterium]
MFHNLLKWVLLKCKAWWESISGKACRSQKDGAKPMVTQEKNDHVLWMADCYTLAKRFPEVTTWMSLLEKIAPKTCSLSPFHYWLWKEIWLASHSTDAEEKPALV